MGHCAKYLAAALCACILSFSHPLRAQEISDEDVSGLFCAETQKESFYNDNNFQSYRMLFPGKDGWIFRSQTDLRTDFSVMPQAMDRLRQFNNALAAHGVQLVILFIPTRGMMHASKIAPSDRVEHGFTDVDAVWENYEAAAESMRRQDIHVVTIDKSMREQDYFYKRDHHWNPVGAQKTAEHLARYIKNMDVYREIPQVQYVTHSAGQYDFEGVSKKVFMQLCETRQPPERITMTYTEPAQLRSAEMDLFGQTSIPQVVLAGTSNSTQIPSYANFEGFLKEALQTDILNMSVSAGGMDTAILAYLNSGFYKNDPAKILIWEIPAYYSISNHMAFFREAVPAALGDCGDRAIAKAKGVVISKNSQMIFNRLLEKRVTGSDYYVYIKYDRPIEQPFKVDLRYAGNRDRYNFKPREGRAEGPYFMIMRDDKRQYLNKLILLSPSDNLGMTADISLCRGAPAKKPGFGELNFNTVVMNTLSGIKGFFNAEEK